jgi:hypothetical protein
MVWISGIAVALAMLRLGAEIWSIILTSMTLAALGIAVLGVRFHRRRMRAFCLGAVLAGGAYFFCFASPTLARGAADPGRRIAQSLVTVPVAAAGGSAATLCHGLSHRLLDGRCARRSDEARPTDLRGSSPPE